MGPFLEVQRSVCVQKVRKFNAIEVPLPICTFVGMYVSRCIIQSWPALQMIGNYVMARDSCLPLHVVSVRPTFFSAPEAAKIHSLFLILCDCGLHALFVLGDCIFSGSRRYSVASEYSNLKRR